MADTITIVRIPALPPFTGTLADDDELVIWKASNDTTYHLTVAQLRVGMQASGVQVPISFDSIVNQTYQGTNNALPNYVAELAGLVPGAVIDQVTVDSAILSPVTA